jgi:hypothetical protein
VTRLSLWNYVSVGALVVSGLTLALFLLSAHSYWLMRFFFAVAVPVSTLPILLAPVFAVGTVLLSLGKGLRWKTTWTIILWLSVFAFSIFSFLGAFFTKYEVAASASFDNQKYYLIKFMYIDSYEYKLYRCEPLGLFCSRSSGYIGIPYQHNPIYLRYNLETRKVYIQNVDQIIQAPN